jgi:iron complex outermembrane recepter protein
MKSNLPPWAAELPKTVVGLAVLAACASAAAQASTETTTPSEPAVVLSPVTVSEKQERERYARAFRPPEVSVGVLGDRSQLDTPFSVSSFNRELIDLQQAVTASDVLKNDPSVTSSSSPGDSALYAQIRGFQAGGLINGLQAETVRPNQRNGFLFNVERIDLLKGVSAFLLGGTARMPLGGVINYVTKTPTAQPLTRFTLGYSDRQRVLVQGDLSRRFGEGDAVGVRVNLATQRGETPIDGQDFRSDMAAFATDWRVSRELTVRAAFETYESEDRAYRDRYGVNGGFAIPAAPDPRTNHTNRWARQFSRGSYGFLQADWKVAPDWLLSVKYLNGKEPERGYDGSYAQLVGPNGELEVYPGILRGSLSNQTGNATLRGFVETGPIGHELVFNVSRSRSLYKFSYDDSGASFGPFPSNLYAPSFIDRPAFDENLPIATGLAYRGSGVAVSDLITFTERWSALIGLRHQAIEGQSYFGPGASLSDAFDNRKTSPVLAVMFKPVPRMTLYAHYAEGLEPGPTAPDTGVANPNQAFDASVAKQMELGAKWESADKLLLSATLFDIERPLSFTNQELPLPRFVVDGTQRHRGLELFASGPVSDAVSLIGGLTLFDAKQEETGDPLQNGKRPVGVPDHAASLTADWRIAAVPGLGAYLGAFRFGKQYVDALNTQAIPAWTRFDGGLRYRAPWAGRSTSLALSVDNLFDKRYWASAGAGLQFGTPRTWRVSTTVDF